MVPGLPLVGFPTTPFPQFGQITRPTKALVSLDTVKYLLPTKLLVVGILLLQAVGGVGTEGSPTVLSSGSPLNTTRLSRS